MIIHSFPQISPTIISKEETLVKGGRGKTARRRAVLSFADRPAGVGAEDQIVNIPLGLAARGGFNGLGLLHAVSLLRKRCTHQYMQKRAADVTDPRRRKVKNFQNNPPLAGCPAACYTENTDTVQKREEMTHF